MEAAMLQVISSVLTKASISFPEKYSSRNIFLKIKQVQTKLHIEQSSIYMAVNSLHRALDLLSLQSGSIDFNSKPSFRISFKNSFIYKSISVSFPFILFEAISPDRVVLFSISYIKERAIRWVWNMNTERM